jgi:hypothetical protein
MTTGACGIDCTVCRLHVRGVCSTCGAGTSMAGREKLAAQQRLFGTACPMLACAVERKVGYCLRDCDDFPCEVFTRSDYPYSEGWMSMQSRRREEAPEQSAAWPESTPEFWDMLSKRSVSEVTRSAGATHEAGVYALPCLNETWLVDPARRTVTRRDGPFGGEWDRQIPFLALAYLTSATEADLTGEMVPPRDLLPGQDYFQGHNTVETADLESTFGTNPDLLVRAATSLGAERLDQADVSVRLHIFPKLPVDILVWVEDEEFPAKVTILLDRGTVRHYPVEGVANAVNLLTRRLLLAAREHAR